MSAPRVTIVAPASPAARAGLQAGDELLSLNGRAAARRDRVPAAGRRRSTSTWWFAGTGPTVPVGVRQGRRRAARARGLLGRLRPGADLRQPLRLLLHLPAAQGDAPEPVPEGRRLPALLPLRQLHHPHPVHRARRRAGPHRAPRAPVRLHPRHRPRGAGRHAAQPEGRHQPALAPSAARRRHRGPRPGGGLPRGERRRGARRHHGRHPRRVPRAGHRRRGAARAEPTTPTSPSMRPHTVAEAAGGLRHRRPLAGGLRLGARTPPGLRRRRVLPAGRPGLPAGRRPTTGSPSTRTASAWSGPSSGPSAGDRRRRRRGAPRVLRLGRRGAGRGLPGAPLGPAAPCRTDRDPTAEPVDRGHRRLRRPGARAPGRRHGGATCGSLAVDNRFFGGNIGVAGLLTGADLARALDGETAAAATCCPTPASRRGGSSTG